MLHNYHHAVHRQQVRSIYIDKESLFLWAYFLFSFSFSFSSSLSAQVSLLSCGDRDLDLDLDLRLCFFLLLFLSGDESLSLPLEECLRCLCFFLCLLLDEESIVTVGKWKISTKKITVYVWAIKRSSPNHGGSRSFALLLRSFLLVFVESRQTSTGGTGHKKEGRNWE